MNPSRRTPRRSASPLAPALLSLLLAACSGGGGGDAPSADPAPPEDDPPAVADDGVAGADPGAAPGEDVDPSTTDDGVPIAGGEPDAGDVPPPADCSIAGVNGWVDERMRDFYLYADQVPVVDLAAYDDPDELVEDLRVPPDDFSNIADEAAQTRRSEEGRLFGFGHWLRFDANDLLRFRRVRAGSPAAEAGIERGDVLIEANGVPVLELSDAQWDAFYGEPDVPTRQTLLVRRGDEAPRSLEIESADYRFVTVDLARVYERDGVRVAYLSVGAFYETTRDELDGAIEWLAGRNIDELMLDFRYNPGGRSAVARRFAAQLVGAGFAGREFQIRRHNARYAELDEASLLDAVTPALALPRIVALVSDATASASESVVNGLEPYVDVTVIGTTTRGKPFTSRGQDRCGKTLNAMHAIRTNAAGVSVAGGIAPDCLVEDAFLFPRADARDALTAAGIDFLTTGACPVGALAGVPRARADDGTARSAGPGERERDTPADTID